MSDTVKAGFAVAAAIIAAMACGYLLPEKKSRPLAVGIGIAAGILARALLGIGG